MEIIIRFVVRNIKEKKFRTFLILFSVTISAALFFASNAITDTMINMFRERMMQYYGSTDILIKANDKSPSQFFRTNEALYFKDKTDYIIGAVGGSGYYKRAMEESVQFTLQGINYEDLQIMTPIKLSTQGAVEPFEGKKIIINEKTAEKFGFKIGDTLELLMNDVTQRFEVVGIALPIGPFSEDGKTIYGIVPRTEMAKLNENYDEVNIMYIKASKPEYKTELLDELTNAYGRYSVTEPFSEEEIRQQLGPLPGAFMMVTLVVVFISMFIIYSSFKVITTERLPVIGTFRSIGATKKMTNLVMLMESAVYGVIGGLVGCALGILILYLISSVMSSGGVSTSITFSIFQLIAAFFVALIISLVSSIMPVLQVSKISVKDIVLNNITKNDGAKNWKLPCGIGFFIASIILPPFVPMSVGTVVDMACLIMLIFSLVLLIPYISIMLVKVLENVYGVIFGNEGILAIKNLREDKNIINNTILLCIGITAMLTINVVSTSAVEDISNFFVKTSSYDILLEYSEADRGFENSLYSVDGVEDIYGIYEAHNLEVSDKKNKIGLIQGVDNEKYRDYFKYDFPENTEELFGGLDNGRNILITSTLKDLLDVNEGETISINMPEGMRDYTVIGFFKSSKNNGNFALISDRFLKQDSGNRYFSSLYIKTNKDPEEVETALKKQLTRVNIERITTLNRMAKTALDSNKQIYTVLKGFSVMTVLIGIFGFLNNLIISFINRRRSLAVLKSIGMSKKQIVKMIFIESLSIGVIGGAIGIIGGVVAISIIPYFILSLGVSEIQMMYSKSLLIIYLVVGIAITLFASISPALKSSKLNIIEAIKYE